MMITPEQVDSWLQAKTETQNLEFKEAKNQYDTKKLFKYCVAIANEGGGHLLLGVTDKVPRAISNTQAFPDVMDITAKIFNAVGFRVDVEEVAHTDGRVLVFSIPSRPQGTAYHIDGTYLMRLGEQLVPMSQDRLRHIFAEGQPVFEAQVALINVSPEEIVSLLDTQSYFELIELPYPADRSGVLERLVSEKLIIKTEESYSITNLGALLFAKNLDSFSDISRKSVRVTTYDGKGKLKTKRDILGKKGYAVGFEGLVEYINGQLPANEVIGQALRESVPMFPEIAIRELVANALIHQDLSETGASVSVDIFNNRLEISNPGLPFIEADRFIDEYQSRNERLADLMRRLRICEEKGSGIDKVVSSIETFQFPPLDIRIGQKRTTTILFSYKQFSDMDKSDKVRACFQHCVLRYLMGEKMTNQSLRERFGLSNRQSDIASRVVGLAVEENLIKLEDPDNSSRRYAKYIPYWA